MSTAVLECHTSQIMPFDDERLVQSYCRPFRQGEFRVWTLYDMIRLVDASRIMVVGNLIQSYYSNVAVDLNPDRPLTEYERAKFVKDLSFIKGDCDSLYLVKTTATVSAYLSNFSGGDVYSHAHVRTAVNTIDATMKAELYEHTFAQIDPASVKYMRLPEEHDREPVFGKAAANAFGSSMEEARGAGICLAIGRGTSCVFHCMRVVEKGLIALAHELNVPFRIPFEYLNWLNIIELIEKEIRKLEQLPAGPAKADMLKMYSEAASQFFYFKNAWRNHVAHARDTYDPEQAEKIFIHVGDFMGFLAKGGLHD
jgi:hypothetical protein